MKSHLNPRTARITRISLEFQRNVPGILDIPQARYVVNKSWQTRFGKSAGSPRRPKKFSRNRAAFRTRVEQIARHFATAKAQFLSNFKQPVYNSVISSADTDWRRPRRLLEFACGVGRCQAPLRETAYQRVIPSLMWERFRGCSINVRPGLRNGSPPGGSPAGREWNRPGVRE